MKVILQTDVVHVGAVGDVVKVKDGFARNYLVPRGLAVVADESNIRRLDHQKRVAASRAAKLRKAAEEIAARLSNTAVSIRRQAGEDGKLFGAVTNREIADALGAEGFALEKKQVVLDEPLKNLGVFSVPVNLHKGVQATVKVYVIQE